MHPNGLKKQSEKKWDSYLWLEKEDYDLVISIYKYNIHAS